MGEARARAPHRVVLAIGSNLGDRAETLQRAARDIADLDGFELDAVSAFVESAAVKPDGVDEAAPRYLNAVLLGRYAGDPHDLLDSVNGIEAEHGRVRAERWGDRTLDIDVVAVDDLQLADDRLVVPHPRAAERDFVLVPWAEVDPDAVLPGRGRVRDLLARIPNTVQPYRGGDE
ncbi:2-amino-4-hydroxy-6-hydroxymethyldihydropteridine diphosphokinase [Cryobacterium tepidiphilum]|jgi:2-amino-4-hydroxy-6-hydroxymethyldihydropteridine diphosphokinase|uniref:2-amino-4-hydroxy-6-hydroxymethyldihydropteridine diphosphokinase n=2 Tax=Cryobacterium tepidiphilum TaxID=2486026 RepID=A0A3M8LRE4_9MICO|nr:2-amino-4-hydroxy-6-hydroxymethyldihydropteridine diphosphokinase [Cryobacterium tepidiphilum]